MTLFEKIISMTFAIIVLIVSLLGVFTLGGVLEPEFGSNIIGWVVEKEFLSKFFFLISAILLGFSIKEIAFGKKVIREGRDGIVLENETGKLIISRESLESLIAGEAKEILGTESITSKTVLDEDKKLIVDVNVVINKEVPIKEISSELQRRIREVLKRTADLNTKNINIRIKNISNKKTKKVANGTNSNTETKDKENKGNKENTSVEV